MTPLAVLGVMVAAAAPLPITVLEELGSNDYQVRQAASRRLLADPNLTVQDIAALWPAATTAEQRHRLIALARHHLLRSIVQGQFAGPAVAAIGVTHKPVNPNQMPELDRPAVRVVQTLPGFPGHAHLHSDDLILAIDGQFIPATTNPAQIASKFVEMVHNREAGSAVRLTVLRDGRTIETRLTLARHSALEAMYRRAKDPLAPARLVGPFEARWQLVREQLFAATGDAQTLTVDWPDELDGQPLGAKPQLNTPERRQ